MPGKLLKATCVIGFVALFYLISSSTLTAALLSEIQYQPARLTLQMTGDSKLCQS
ncbi:hypothetical protein BN440_2432 [Erwinia amylovora MR1]|nr:hypothetical protein BN440_2432 [Erwinia amylovora MR1]